MLRDKLKLLNSNIEQKTLYAALFLMCFTLAAPVFNALTSTATVLALLALIYYCYKHKTTGLGKIPVSIYLGLAVFAAAIIASSLAIGDKKSLSYAFRFIYWLLPLFVMFLLNKAAGRSNVVFYGFNAALLVSSVAAVVEFWNTDAPRLTGIYGHPNHYASMLAIILPVCTALFIGYYKEKHDSSLTLFALMNILLGFATLIRTGSRGGVIGVCLGLILALFFYALKQKAKKVLLAALVLAVAAVPVYQFNSSYFFRSRASSELVIPYDAQRLYFLEGSYHMWQDHKAFGVGLANWHEQYVTKYMPPRAKTKYDMPHNMYVYFFSTAGTVGGVGFLLLWLAIFLYFFRNLLPLNAGGITSFAMLWVFFSISVHGGVDIGLTNKLVARLFFGTLGIMLAEVWRLKQQGKP